MRKLYNWAIALTVLMIPGIAQADWKEYLPSPESWFNSLMSGVIHAIATFFTKLWETLNNTIIPHNPYLGLALIGLTMVWLLSIPPIRKLVGRLSGPALSIFLGIAIGKAIFALAHSISTGVAIVLFIGCILLTKIMFKPITMLIGWLISLFKSTLGKADTSLSGCVAGAFLVAGIINGKWLSTEANHYLPSYVSSGMGAIVGSYLLYKKMKERRTLPATEEEDQPASETLEPVATIQPTATAATPYRDPPPTEDPVTVMEKPQAEPVMVQCSACNQPTPAGRYCTTCGSPQQAPTSTPPASTPIPEAPRVATVSNGSPVIAQPARARTSRHNLRKMRNPRKY